MECRWRRLGLAAGFAALVLVSRGGAQADTSGTIADHMAKGSLNVVLTVSDMEKAKAFYGGVLGLEPMAPIQFGADSNPVFFPEPTEMIRYQVGSHEIKLITSSKPLKLYPGGTRTGIGFRMVNFPIADPEALFERVEVAGLSKPAITELPGSNYRFGMLQDPDGNQVEFHFYEGDGPEGWTDRIHIALTVADVEKTRAFYGEILGMEEAGSFPMPGRPETTIYLFRLGETTVKFWSFGPDLPVYSGRHLDAYGFRYLQYQVKDIDAVHEFIKARGGTIELPPTPMNSMPVSLMFVADPDGIINAFFGLKP